MRTLWRKGFACEELTGDGKGGINTVHYKAIQGGKSGKSGSRMVEAGSRTMNDEDIVDNIKMLCKALTGDKRGGTCPVHYKASWGDSMG